MTWTLVLFTIIAAQESGSANRAAVDTNTKFLDFKDKTTCDKAAQALTLPDTPIPNSTVVGAIYRVTAICVQRD